jgi:hypothetical protein
MVRADGRPAGMAGWSAVIDAAGGMVKMPGLALEPPTGLIWLRGLQCKLGDSFVRTGNAQPDQEGLFSADVGFLARFVDWRHWP